MKPRGFLPGALELALISLLALVTARAAAIGIGMIEGDYHWASDVVAGALLGQVIGWTVGSHFRRAYRGDPPDERAWLVLPGTLPDGFGISASARF